MSLDHKAVGRQLDSMTDAELHELELLLRLKREQRHAARNSHIHTSHDSHDHTPR